MVSGCAADYRAVIADALALLRLAAEAAGRPLTYLDRSCDALCRSEWLTVAEAFRIHAGIELLDTLSPQGVGDRDMLASRARRAGLRDRRLMTAGPIFSARCWRRGSNPNWAWAAPTILYEYPRAEAALARAKAG